MMERRSCQGPRQGMKYSSNETVETQKSQHHLTLVRSHPTQNNYQIEGHTESTRSWAVFYLKRSAFPWHV